MANRRAVLVTQTGGHVHGVKRGLFRRLALMVKAMDMLAVPRRAIRSGRHVVLTGSRTSSPRFVLARPSEQRRRLRAGSRL
jgi:hypothetical protein